MQRQNCEEHEIKTLIVDFSKGYGGASMRVLALLKNLPADQVALAGLANSPIMEAAKSIGACTYTIGNKKYDPRILKRLVDVVKKDEYQIIDTHNVQAKFWGSFAAPMTDAVLVSTIHSWYTHEHGEKSLKGKLYTNLELSTNRKLGAYITVSKKDREMLIQSKIPQDDVELIYNAVRIDPEKIQANYREQLLFGKNLPVDALICSAVGRIVNVKGYDILIEAFRLLSEKIPHLFCAIVGDGELLQEYRQLVRDSGLAERVQLLGFRAHDQVLPILKASDIFVMPSRYEGTPIALLEAAAMGKAIVASRVGGIPELVVDGEQALLVEPENPQILADTLMGLAKDPDRILSLGLAAQKQVQENFCLEKMVARTQQTYWKAWQKYNPRIRENRRDR